jgi:hypothetical protein
MEDEAPLQDFGGRHWVRGSKMQSAYWRRRPYCYERPSPAQLRARELFGKVAAEHGKGKRGLVTIERDGVVKDIPKSAESVMAAFKDMWTSDQSAEEHRSDRDVESYDQ